MRKTVSGILLMVLLSGMFTLAFGVKPVLAQNVGVYINSDGSVSPSDAPISSVDNVTYTFTGSISYPTFDGIVVERSDIVIDGNGYTVQGNHSDISNFGTGISLTDISNVTIKKTNVEGFSYGIDMENSSDNTVSWNNLTGDYYGGIRLGYSSNTTVSWNSATGNHIGGISLVYSSNNTVSWNNATANGNIFYPLPGVPDYEGWGISLTGSSSNIISGNNVETNIRDGIELNAFPYDTPSSNNIISGNNVTANLYGIMLYGSHYNNTIRENEVMANSAGIAIFVGYSSNNIICRNDFIGNSIEADINPAISTDSRANIWNDAYPCGGNYWSDYNGVDSYSGTYQNVTGSDGIGDTPYIIDANNTDNYPLMNPSASPDIAVTDLTSSKTVIGQGHCGLLNVTFENLGTKIEAFNATIYANSTAIHSEQIMLALTDSTLSIIWNTTGFAYGNYTISACVEPLPQETDISNNNFTDDWVFVTGQGDLTGGMPNALDFVPDGQVNVVDVAVVSKLFNQKVPPAPANCDVSGPTLGMPDGKIDISDVALVAKQFGNHYTYP